MKTDPLFYIRQCGFARGFKKKLVHYLNDDKIPRFILMFSNTEELDILRRVATRTKVVKSIRTALDGPGRIDWGSEMQEGMARRELHQFEREIDDLVETWEKKFNK